MYSLYFCPYFILMDYKQVCIRTNDASLKEVLIALLTEHGFEGFEEREREIEEERSIEVADYEH